MGNCIFCGQAAGFLRSEHPECREKDNARLAEQPRLLQELERQATEAALDATALEAAPARFAAEAGRPELAGADTRTAIVRAYGNAIDRLLAGDGVTPESEKMLDRFASEFSLTEAERGERDAQSRLVKALILRDAAAGIFTSRLHVPGTVPFLVRKDEVLLWLFNHVRFLEVREFTHYEGHSAGVSVRLMKGLYYRTGAFHGRPVKEEHTVGVDEGILGVTQHALYFAGSKKSLHLPLASIVTIEPYSDGIGIQKDGTSAKPMTFTPLDGWFAYNLIKNLAAL